MTTNYKVVHWEFDNLGWSRQIKAWVRTVGEEAIADAVGVNKSTVKGWASGNQPSMMNFVKACDEMSLDPRQFFTTSE